MLRRTKIVTTLGPATDDPATLEALIKAGANVVRLNFSHGKPEDHEKRATMVRDICKRLGTHVAILGDLQGPKIRIAKFVHDSVTLDEGDGFILDAELARDAGTGHSVGIDYKELPEDVNAGDILLLDDGRVRLQVDRVEGAQVHTTVTIGGKLSNNKGINRLGGGLSAAALTEKDYEDIKLAAKIGVDYLAVSFPRSGEDMHEARRLLRAANGSGMLCAKIERAEAVATDAALDDIIRASEAVMVARGDLGVEIGDAQLVGKQKRIIERARQLNKVVITATQMMESMIENPMPTRAEVMDVANAVLDGTDAVMLSAETAAGKFPVATVKAMAEICLGAETHPSARIDNSELEETFTNIQEATAITSMYAATHLTGVKAIIALTESGSTAKLMSRIHTILPIFSLSRHQDSRNRCALYRGVYPVAFDSTKSKAEDLTADAINEIKARGHLNAGDLVVLTHGDVMETVGSTNTCKIIEVK
ncbi:pyruvate kinase [Pseudidiomarina terrestris]|uniref:Pyruvate kinase n=1 Tax=Pseudidiomarina terrestris TaxID=2820060 RepID=A0AAW7QWB7_9GAMM|nr:MULTISPECIES: pyruvate kinase [unclassified Pseudidiomarina]MDN7123711.1 pyruvate kinase [Pseudidiomarina sp. 1APP75-32.1]MDN7128565.1 pyruvate kinase [Pseudidiomarina sp. 1APR75-15]MDN7135177.1 pyruvate kinase [Pseudidiomarina sp. 1ASP75-5]MDN7137846.1 pyruvate kinase [Pseudidiomarina sp. 1ASP75-14]